MVLSSLHHPVDPDVENNITALTLVTYHRAKYSILLHSCTYF